MAKETTIDWIKREMEKFGERSHLLLDWESFDIIIEDAREMEKEQIMQSHIDGFDHIVAEFKKKEYAEKYYNETYKKQ
jgi:hypothetical protein